MLFPSCFDGDVVETESASDCGEQDRQAGEQGSQSQSEHSALMVSRLRREGTDPS